MIMSHAQAHISAPLQAEGGPNKALFSAGGSEAANGLVRSTNAIPEPALEHRRPPAQPPPQTAKRGGKEKSWENKDAINMCRSAASCSDTVHLTCR